MKQTHGMDITAKKYVIVVQCHIVKERCSGFLCEHAFNEREGSFEIYKNKNDLRFLTFTCGGCCGRGTLRKLQNAIKQLKKQVGIVKEEIVVHFSSCGAFESFHGPKCPHRDYITDIVQNKAGLDFVLGSRYSKTTEARRAAGQYPPRK